MRHAATLFPSLVICVGYFGARVGLRLKAILAQRPPEIHTLFPMLVIADCPLQELNRYTVPDYIPLPRWREDDYIAWEPAPENWGRQELFEQFFNRVPVLQQRIEEKYQAMRDPNLHLQLAEHGFAVGTQVGPLQTRLILVASLAEALGAGIVFLVGQLLQEIVRQHGPPGSPVIAFLNLTDWKTPPSGLSAGNAYDILQELHQLMDREQPLFSRCYLLEAERQNGTRLLRLEDEAEMVASLLGLLLMSDLYQNEGLYATALVPPTRVPSEAGCRPSVYAFNTFCTASLVLPRQLLRIVTAVRLGSEMFSIWLRQPPPDPRETDQWQQYFLSSNNFAVGTVKARFLERLNAIPETDYLPRIIWERVPRQKWSDAIASADSFCGRYRIPVVIDQLAHIKTNVLLPEFEVRLKEAVDALVYSSLGGVQFARKALEDLRKTLEATAEQMQEIVVLSTPDLSSYRFAFDETIANAPAWYSPFLYLFLPTALLTAGTFSADWGSPIEEVVVGTAWTVWFVVGAFTNWYYDTKIQRLREEYWDAVRQKWRNYLRAICDQLTLEFFREAAVLVQQEIARLDNLTFSIQTVRDLFDRVPAEVLEEDFISKMNVLTPEQIQALYEKHRPNPLEQTLQFIDGDLRTLGWRQGDPDRLGQTLFLHTFALWTIFETMSVEGVMASNILDAQEQLTQLRERLSVLLRLPRVWVVGDEQGRVSVEVHERLLLALADKENTVLAEYIGQPAQQQVDLLSTADAERVTWALLWANFPIEVLGVLPILREQREQWQQQEHVPADTDHEEASPTSAAEPIPDEGSVYGEEEHTA